MKKIIALTFPLIFLSFFINGWAEEESKAAAFSLKFKLGFETEILKRSLWWEEEEKTTSLQAYLALFRLESEIFKGLKVAVLGGYSSSNFESLVFRRLPFSIDFDVGALEGSLLGAEINQFLAFNNLGLGAEARFLASAGKEKKWTIPDLAVEGELKSQPNWKMLVVGPYLGYNGYENFLPYVAIQYHYFWGQFTLREIIENLAGTENKKIQTKGKLAVTLGANFLLTSRLALTGEAMLIPHKNGQDWGFRLNGTFSF